MDALLNASDRTARVILTALCADAEIQKKALKYLSQLEPQAIQAARDSGQLKRKAPTSGLSICVQCEGPFDEADNAAKVCQYHDGVWPPSVRP